MATEQEKRAIRGLVKGLENPCLVELGAHRGEDERWLTGAFDQPVRHIMVEPDTENVRFLLAKSTGPMRRVIVGAVCDHDGSQEFYFSENKRDDNHASGSLRKPTGHVEQFPWITFPFKGIVATFTLDTIFEKEGLSKIDLLWVDIQGAEKDMIAGASEALKHTRYLFMEAETTELYEGEALKPDLITLLPGWTLLEDFGYNILLRNDHFIHKNQSEPIVVQPADSMKLIGLMPIRNESWCLELSLRAAIEWCDRVVVLDHASTDESKAIIRRIAAENPGRVFLMHEFGRAWDEMRHRQSMLEQARKLGATHIALVDADEVLSATLVPKIRLAIESLPAKSMLQLPWIELRGSLHRFHSNGMWSDRWVSMAFKDSPDLRWEGDQFHHREVFGIQNVGRFSNHSEGGLLHLWGVSERRLRAKHAFYKMTERIRWPEKKVEQIEQYYNFWRMVDGFEFANVPPEWWQGFDLSLVRESPDWYEILWQEEECQKFAAQYGLDYFKGLDLFGVLNPRSAPPKISLCHATARFPSWRIAANDWLRKADHPENVEYILAIHEADRREVHQVELPAFAQASILLNSARSCSVDNWNAAAREATGQILINVADDWFPCEHWDTKLLEMLPDPNAGAAIDVDTGSHHNLIPFSIITRPYLERLKTQYGYDGFFFPEYTSMYSDEEFTWLARRDGVVIPAWQLYFEHRHPVHGKAEMDDVYRKQNAPEHYAEGKKLMDRRLKEFGISLVQALPPRKKLLICAPGETFSSLWVNHWTALVTTLEKYFDMDGDGNRGAGVMFGYSTNVYVTRSSMLDEILASPVKPDYVLWLDDDNLCTPQMALQLVQDLENDPELDAVVGWCFLEREEGPCISAGHFNAYDKIEFMTHKRLFAASGPVQAIDGTGFPLILMRYRLIEKVGATAFYPRFSEHYRWGFSGEDISFCLAAREAGAKLAVDRRIEVPHLKLGQYRPAITSTPLAGNSQQEKLG